MTKLTGHAAKFDSPSLDLGGFTEFIRPGAFRKALQRADVRAFVNHDSNLILARTGAGLTLREDSIGLLAEIDPPPTTLATDTVENVKAGLWREMSFAFRLDPARGERWSVVNDQLVREITEVEELIDVSVVSMAAYPSTTVSVQQPSAVDQVQVNKNRLQLAELDI